MSQNKKQLTENTIIEIIKKKKHHHLRPNNSPENLKTISKLITKFILIAILFFFIAFFIFEYFDIYPFTSSITEEFKEKENITNLPQKYIVEPEPQNKYRYPIEGTEMSSIFSTSQENNNKQLLPDLQDLPDLQNLPDLQDLQDLQHNNIDMGIVHSHRYYKSIENSPDAILAKQRGENVKDTPKMTISSLRQEIPSTYIISLLKQVKLEEFNINKHRINNLDSLLDTLYHLKKNINNAHTLTSDNKIILFNNIINNLEKEKLSRLISLFQICKIYIISLINIKLLELVQSHKAHPFQFLRIINSENIGILLPQSTSSKQVALVFNIVTHRKFKTHGFNIQCVINCKLVDGNISCNITSLELLGTPMQNDLPVDKIGMTKMLKGYHHISGNGSPISKDGITGNIEEKLNIPKEKLEQEWINKNKLMNDNIRTVRLNTSTYGVDGSDDIDQKQKDKISELSASQGYSPQLYGSYKCFGVYPDGQSKTLNEIEDPITCQSYIPELDSIGVWDSPCKEDLECPFYNQENGKNGCIEAEGVCEMPVGITRIGFKKYSKYNKKKY